MRNFIIVFLLVSLSSCSLLRKKDKTNSEKETVLSTQTKETEISNDSSETLNYTRITYGGANPFKTPEAKKFMDALFSLSALQMPAKQMDSALNDLKKKFNDLSNAGSALSGPKISESLTKGKTGSNNNKTKEENKDLNEKVKEKHIESDSLFQSIPWYVYLIGIVGVLLFLAFKFDNPN